MNDQSPGYRDSAGKDPTGWRLPAPAFEETVARTVINHIKTCARQHLIVNVPDPAQTEKLRARAYDFADRCRPVGSVSLGAIIDTGKISKGQIQISLDREIISEELKIPAAEINPTFLLIAKPFALRRRGVETRIVASEEVPAPDATLTLILAKAHRWAAELRAGKSLLEIAANAGHSDSYVRVRAQLAFLSPKIQQAILDGRQPPELSVERIVRTKNIPLDWVKQERIFGF